jgi:hypothetical protein
MIELITWCLIGFGFGAILAGAWMRQRWVRDVARVHQDKIAQVCMETTKRDRAEARAVVAEQQVVYWHRRYLDAKTQQVIVHRYEVAPVAGVVAPGKLSLPKGPERN